MKIVLLDSWKTDRATGSGTAASVAGLVRGLEGRGHRVSVIRPRRTSGVLPLLLQRVLFNLSAGIRVQEEDPDVVLGVDLDGFGLPDEAPVPRVVALKGVAADEARFEAGWPRLGLRIAGLLERHNAGKADRVVVPSRYSAEAARRLYGLSEDTIRVVPEGLDLTPWDRLLAGDHTPTDQRPPVILCVARLYPRKNVDTLVRAMATVRRALPRASLRIVGGGPELEKLRRRTAELDLEGSVQLLGPLADDEDVRREFMGARCFCLPSLQEGFGIVFLEAMAAGLPVVAGRAGAVPEVVRDGQTGVLVDPLDSAALATALIQLLSNPELGLRYGQEGRRVVREYSLERTAEAFAEVLESL